MSGFAAANALSWHLLSVPDPDPDPDPEPPDGDDPFVPVPPQPGMQEVVLIVSKFMILLDNYSPVSATDF
jgi:hypothetical protein